jgi:alpha-D-xyloside xylohydrolase
VLLSESRPPDLGRGVHFSFRLEAGEVLYGWGEQFGAFARTRGRLRLHALNTPSILQRHRSYSAVPFFISRRGYGLLLLNGHPSRWRIDPRRHELSIDASGGAADYLVIQGDTPRDILFTYTALTGRPPLLPRWAHGLWGTGYPQENQDQVLALAREHRRRSIPLDVIILDYHWEEAFHNFRWRRSLFPDPDRLIAELRDLGIRLGLILTPFVNRENIPLEKRILNWRLRNLPPGEERTDDRALPEYEECVQKDLLSHPRVWWWFGRGGMIDFTSRRAVRWWAGKLQPLLRQGIAFFKNDDGEYLPLTARSAIGIPGAEHHNLYGFYYGKATFEALQEIDDRRPLIYARSVWAGSQRYPALFLGDQTPTFHHMRATLRAGLNLGLAGYAYWTADVFGLDGRTTPETHMRYAQWALFAPIARYFWRPPAIDPTRFPWSHGPAAEDNFRRLTELRYRLLPYYGQLAWEAYLSGVPMLRPMMLEYPEDGRFALIDDQVMIGDRLLLAPVLDSGARSKSVILPSGIWHDFWTGKSWAGGVAATVPAPLDRVPLLVRGGAIVPMLPPSASTSVSPGFGGLELHLWPPFGGSYSVREDDGLTRAYQRGEAVSTRIEVEQHEEQVDVRVSPPEGNLPGIARERHWTVVLHSVVAVCRPWQQADLQACPAEVVGTEARILTSFPTQQGCFLHVPGVEIEETRSA